MYEQIAQEALNDLIQNGVSIKEDRINDAINFAEDCYVWLRSKFTYDPVVDARFLAQAAAVEYVKAKIMGRLPAQSSNFISASEIWARSAAREVSKNRDKSGWYDVNRLYKNLTTPE